MRRPHCGRRRVSGRSRFDRSAAHYYLEIIGADPSHQGRGLGTALISPMVGRADREGVGMYLESSKESNVGSYNRFGFTVTRELHHRRNGPTMWLMWRDPH
jgi:ribosomal protein S18 acetylase RimI-like enzyme